jgi:hypothetical protein
LIRFFVVLSCAAVVLLGASWVALDQQWIEALPSFYFQTLILLLFGTGLLYIYLFKFDRPDFFVQLYLLTMTVKLLAYGAYNFFMILEDKANAAANVVWFMLLYFVFTALEIGFLYQKISKR